MLYQLSYPGTAGPEDVAPASDPRSKGSQGGWQASFQTFYAKRLFTWSIVRIRGLIRFNSIALTEPAMQVNVATAL